MPCNSCTHIVDHRKCSKHNTPACDWMAICGSYEPRPEPFLKPSFAHIPPACLPELIAEVKLFLTAELGDRGWDFEEDTQPLLEDLDLWMTPRAPRTLEEITADVQRAKESFEDCLQREREKRKEATDA